MKIGLLQIDSTVGDFDGNHRLILEGYRRAVEGGAQIVLTPEMAVTGYPPQDLVFKSRFVPLALETVRSLHAKVGAVPLVAGFVEANPRRDGNPFFNAAAILQHGMPMRVIRKTLLPTYDVFDEDRYFQPGENSEPVVLAGQMVGITICEDVWPAEHLHRQLYQIDPVRNLTAQGARIILNLSASPFHLGKQAERRAMLSGLAERHGIPFVYCNAVGGNDQLIFDGRSLAVDASGHLLGQLAAFSGDVAVIDLESPPIPVPEDLEEPAELFAALQLGLSDYMRKCGFRSAVVGLSGGIDSAVTAVLAARTLGPDNVLGITMPTEYSSGGSVSDSQALARNLGIRCLEIPIQGAFDAVRHMLSDALGPLSGHVAEENLQPRLRALALMAASNKLGHLVLTTGNKSELAVGYCTLYGDMAGGLAVISDVPKTMIYRLARWINTTSDFPVIPPATIEKPPSAELRPDQTDQDTLPPYDLLDAILELYVEHHLGVADIIERGFPADTVRWVQRRVDLNEYKREQAAPGLRVTSKAFGAGRRMPVAQRFVEK